MSDWVEGRIGRVVWASPDSGYAVVVLDTDDGPVTVVGELGAALGDGEATGAFLAVEGRMETHQVHGRQFRATGVLQGLPRTLRGLELYLASSGIKGVGPVLAGRIVQTFGLSTPKVISDHPERLAEVRGISTRRADVIGDRWRQDEEGRAVTVLLRGLGLPMRVVHRVKRAYGDRAGTVVAREPYRLVDDIAGVGFRTADALARQQGLPEDDPRRVEAAVMHVVHAAAGDGHCYLPRSRVSEDVGALGVPTSDVDAAMDRREAVGALVTEGERVFGADLYRAEVDVADELIARIEPPSLLDATGEVDRVARALEVDLDPLQRDAVAAALRGGVVVITGGPGTGKTTLVRVLAKAARERGERWKLASPTGRAARRLEEATGTPASTLHRLLEYRPDLGGFGKHRGDPIEADGLVIDEASMVDLPLLRAVLEAVPPGVSLVLVGDADQLPSVGPGRVLRDVVESGAVPVVRLTRVFRQAARSGIIVAANQVLDGRVPASGEQSGHDDFFALVRPDGDVARATVLTVVADRLPANGFDAIADVQVLAPTRRGPLGTSTLNEAMQERLNPDGAKVGRSRFRVGDRVLCTRNRYDVEVFNGDVGRVVAASSTGADIAFDGRMVSWSFDDLDLLDLAYAMTVHKAQGSEYPAVVLALHGSHGIMLRRNLFYTAVTRARRFFCLVGDRRAWQRAASRVGGDERWTALAERLRADSA